jgi:hypothetical protein
MRRTQLLLFSLFLIALGPPCFSPLLQAQSKAGPFTINSSTSPCAKIGVTAQSSVVVKVSGTFSATLQPEVSIQGQPPDNAAVTPSTSTSGTKQSTITAAGSYSGAVGAYDTFLVCVTSYASGTATIYLDASPAINAGLFGGGGGGVSSFNTRTGAVVPVATDYTSLTAVRNLTTPAGTSLFLGAGGANPNFINEVFGPFNLGNGSGYAIGDQGTIQDIQTGATNAVYQVTSIATGGIVTGVSIHAAGTGYTVETSEPTTVTTGGGDGSLLLNVTSVNAFPTGAVTGLTVPNVGAVTMTGGNGSFINVDPFGDTQVTLQAGLNDSQQLNMGWYSSNVMSSPHHALTNRCAAKGTAANPSVVSCGANAGGAFSCATNASGATCVVNTTAVCLNSANGCLAALTTDSTIFVSQVSDEGSLLGVTCNTTPIAALVSSRVSNVSFTLTLGVFTVNPLCFNFTIE